MFWVCPAGAARLLPAAVPGGGRRHVGRPPAGGGRGGEGQGLNPHGRHWKLTGGLAKSWFAEPPPPAESLAHPEEYFLE